MVPCDPIAYLNQEYGINKWHEPLVKNYKWTNLEAFEINHKSQKKI
jgi:hypothetical protein